METSEVMEPAWRTFVYLLVAKAGPEGASLKQMARWTRLAPSTVHKHLQEIVVQGMALRTGRGPGVRYHARPYFSAIWIDPKKRLFDQWGTNVPIDWRFPLVSRVPDEPGQWVLQRLLGPVSRSAGERTFSVIVYGSCAEGTAREKSDLDLLVSRDDPSWDPALKDIVSEANLHAERPIDLRIISGVNDIPQGVRKNVREHGKTVYTTRKGKEGFLESQA